MSHSCIRAWLLCLLCASSIAGVAAESASISGTVRDRDGNPLVNAALSLAGPIAQQATTGSSGQFHFAALPPGEYTLSVVLSGYTPSSVQSIHLQSSPIDTSIVLSRAAAPPLEFQSSGIRGLIDPGGYSASTAGDSTGVLRGIAELKRSNSSLAGVTAKDLPCDLEPQLHRAAAEHPELPDPSLRLGQFYVAHDQPQLAIPSLQHALALDSTSELASRTLAAAWLEAGNFDAARQLLSEPSANRETPELHQLRARADEGSALFKQAADEYRYAAALSPSEERSFGIGYELLLSGSLADAASAFTEGANRYPKSTSMQLGAGTAHFLQGDKAAALSNFLAAVEIDPSDPRSYRFLAASAGAVGDQRDRVLSAFRHYLDLAPGSAEANLYYAVALFHADPSGNATHIVDLLKRAVQLDSTNAQAHLQLAESYVRSSDFTDAATEYEAALRLTADPEPHYRLALAYKRLGRTADSNREMHLFRQGRENTAHQSAAGDRIDLAQFVSVINSPGSTASAAVLCPAEPR